MLTSSGAMKSGTVQPSRLYEEEPPSNRQQRLKAFLVLVEEVIQIVLKREFLDNCSAV
jgi:hypothetical protein